MFQVFPHRRNGKKMIYRKAAHSVYRAAGYNHSAGTTHWSVKIGQRALVNLLLVAFDERCWPDGGMTTWWITYRLVLKGSAQNAWRQIPVAISLPPRKRTCELRAFRTQILRPDIACNRERCYRNLLVDARRIITKIQLSILARNVRDQFRNNEKYELALYRPASMLRNSQG